MKLSPRERKFAAITVSLALFVCLLITEGFLRVLEKLPQKMYMDYGNALERKGLNPGGQFKKNFDEKIIASNGRLVRFKTNSVGFRNDREFALQTDQGVLRILSLGDSFGGGYRLGQDQTYTHLFETALNQAGIKVEMPLALMGDPLTSVQYLKKYGLAYHPHAVLQGVTLGNDLLTITIKDNQNWNELTSMRLTPQCQVPKTWWNKVKWWTNYGRFHVRVARLFLKPNRAIASQFGQYRQPLIFDGLHALGLFLKNPPKEVEQAYQDLFDLMKRYQEMMQEKNIPVWFMIFPQRFQVEEQDWQAAVTEYMLKPDCFDLSIPNRRIMEFCQREGLDCLDPIIGLREEASKLKEKLYMPNGDMHWSPAGNRALVVSLKDDLASRARRLIAN